MPPFGRRFYHTESHRVEKKANPLKTRGRLAWFFMRFRRPQALDDSLGILRWRETCLFCQPFLTELTTVGYAPL